MEICLLQRAQWLELVSVSQAIKRLRVQYSREGTKMCDRRLHNPTELDRCSHGSNLTFETSYMHKVKYSVFSS